MAAESSGMNAVLSQMCAACKAMHSHAVACPGYSVSQKQHLKPTTDFAPRTVCTSSMHTHIRVDWTYALSSGNSTLASLSSVTAAVLDCEKEGVTQSPDRKCRMTCPAISALILQSTLVIVALDISTL